MPANMSTTLNKLESPNEHNRALLRDFYEYMRLKDAKSERHVNDILTLVISFDNFHGGKPFTEIDNKQQVLAFLDQRYSIADDKWVKRERDAEGKYITTYNHYIGLLKGFFRWLTNKDKETDDWETPAFVKIKYKRPLRDSPYGPTQVWEHDEILKIVEYVEPDKIRNKAIITLLWDLDARPHEITALKMGDIKLGENYAEGTIPPTTKTGGGVSYYSMI
jgi:integrase